MELQRSILMKNKKITKVIKAPRHSFEEGTEYQG